MASYNKSIYNKLKEQNERRDLMGGIAGLISGATQGYQREKFMQSADALGQQIGLPQGVGRVIPPGLIAQAMLNKQIAEQAQNARRADLEYQIGQQRAMADADREAARQRWVATEGQRQDQFDRTLDWNRENAASRAKADMDALRFQQGQMNMREGMEQVGETLRGIGGGFKDIIVKGMNRGRDASGVPYAERELIDNLDLQIKDAATQIQQDRLALGLIPNKDGLFITQNPPLSPENRMMLEQRIATRERQLNALQEQLRKVHSGVASRYGVDLNAPVEAMKPPLTDEQAREAFKVELKRSLFEPLQSEEPMFVDPGQ